jgi:hypothetical protein
MHHGMYVSERRWPDAAEGPWILEVDWDLVDGQLGPTSVLIRPVETPPTSHLGARLLRGIRFTDLVESRRDLLADVLRSLERSDPSHPVIADLQQELDHLTGQSWSRPKGRPRIYDRKHYEDVAAIYLSALRTGAHPVQAVASRMHTSSSTAGRWVHTARHKYSLLPETTSGRVKGGELPCADM